MPRSTWSYVAISLVLAVLACSGDSTSPSQQGIAGNYTLRSINGLTIPVIVSLTGNTKLEITGSTIGLDATKGFSNGTSFRKTVDGIVTTPSETCTGIYFINNGAITFSEVSAPNTACGARYTGVWDGTNQIAVEFDPTTHSIYSR